MPGLNGVEFSRMLPADTRVIFTTAFSQYAVEGFRVQAVDYLLKPISYADFLTAAQRPSNGSNSNAVPGAIARRRPARSIFVKTEYRLRQIELDKISISRG